MSTNGIAIAAALALLSLAALPSSAFAISISGTLYAEEGTSTITGVSKTIKLAVGTSTPGVYSTSTLSADGTWIVQNLPDSFAGQSYLVWVDGDTSTRAASFTKASTTANNIYGLDLYQNRLIVKHEGFSGTSTTNAELAFYDGFDDADIMHKVIGYQLELNAGRMLYVAPGTTYEPGGGVVLYGNGAAGPDGDLKLASGNRQDGTATGSIMSIGAFTTSVAGNFYASSTAILTASTGGIVFTSTSTGARKIHNNEFAFPTTTFSGANGSFTFGNFALIIAGNLSIATGTVTAPSAGLTVQGSYANTGGTFTHNSGTLTIAGAGGVLDGTMTNASAFNSLNIQDTGTATTSGFGPRTSLGVGTFSSSARVTGVEAVYSMVSVNNTLYVGTSEGNLAEVYRHDGGTNWTKITQVEAGMIASGGTASIDGIYTMVNASGTLYVGTNEGNLAEVYRYDGGTNWTRVSYGAGTIASGGTSGIDGIYSMASVSGTLYVGTYEASGAAEVYRYDGGTSWTKVSQATAGTIASGGTASISVVQSMVDVGSTLYVGTYKSNAAEVYRYDGGTTWTKVSQATAGTIASGGTANIDYAYSMTNIAGTLYAGTGEAFGANAEVYRYDGGTTWTKVSQATAGTIASGGTAGIDGIISMTNVSDTLYAGTYDFFSNSAEVYRFDGGTTWTKVSQATAGTIASGGTAGIDTVYSMTNVNGTLYVGTGESNSAEVYRYDGGTSWTKVSQATVGSIASGGTAAIGFLNSMENSNGSLYVGVGDTNLAEVYRFDGGTSWTKVSQEAAGTIASGGTAGINNASSLSNVGGTLYLGTGEPNAAEVYRYDGGTTWTKVSQATAGTIVSGGTSGLDSVPSMTNVSGTLYVSATNGTNAVEIYRYDGGTTWTKVSQATAGTIASGGTANIDNVPSMIGVGGNLYVGTNETNAAEVYRYDGGTTWTKISQATAGTIANGGTANIDSVASVTAINGVIYIGTTDANAAEVYRYDGGTTWTRVSFGAGTIASGGTANIDTIRSLENVNGTLYAGTFDAIGNTAEVYRYDGGTNWTRVSFSPGTIVEGGTTGIDSVTALESIHGILYVGAHEAQSVQVYRYKPAGYVFGANASTTDLTLVSGTTTAPAEITIAGDFANTGGVFEGNGGTLRMTGAGGFLEGAMTGSSALENVTIASLSAETSGAFQPKLSTTTGALGANPRMTGIDHVYSMVNIGGTLYVGTNEGNAAEIYRYDGGTTWTKVSQATAGTIASGGRASIDTIASMVNVNGTLYVGTYENNAAEVYRYDGGTTWTKVSQAAAGTIASGGTATVDQIYSMANLNGTLYAGTYDVNGAEVYRYDGGTTWTKVSQATAGTIASGGTANIDRIESMASIGGTLYVGTYETNLAEVYRFDGGTTWTKVSQATAGTVASGGTANIDGITSMANVNGTLYVGTYEFNINGEAEVYRYDGGTTWTKVTQATAGTIASGGTADIYSIVSMVVSGSALYVGTAKSSATEVYRYDGGTTWTKVSQATAGTIASGGTANIDQIYSMESIAGVIYVGTYENNSSEIYRYDGGTTWVKVSQATAGIVASGSTLNINGITAMANVGGTLYVSTYETNLAEIYRYDGGTTWTRVSYGSGQIASGGTANIDYIYSMANVNGTLYAGTWESNAAEVYRYDGGTSWTRVSYGAGQIASGERTNIDSVHSMANVNGTLYIGTFEISNAAEIYRYDGGTSWTKVSQATAGTIASAGTANIDGVYTLANVDGTLYAGTFESNVAEVYRYDGGTSWTRVSFGAGTIDSGGTASINGVTSMHNLNGTLYVGTNENNLAEVYRYDGGTDWTAISSAAGTIDSGGTASIDGVYALTSVNGTLYASTFEANAAEVYQYVGGTDWTRISSGAGTIANGGSANFDYAWSMANVNGTLYVGMYETDRAEVYRYKPAGYVFGSVATTTDLTLTAGTTTPASTGLSITGNYTNNALFSSGSSTVYFAGTAAQTATGTLSGTSAFYQLTFLNSSASTTIGAAMSVTATMTAATAGVKLVFAPYATTTAGNLVITGTAGNEVFLFSSTSGAQWRIDITGTSTVTYARVKDSHACNGNGLIVAVSSTDGTGNNCWSFVAGGTTLSLLHYRFRDDSSAEASEYFIAAEDTAITTAAKVRKGDRIRLRLSVSNTGGATASGITYRIEYSSTTCSTWAALRTWGAASAGEHWGIDLSQWIGNGAPTTNNSGLTDPGGKSFVAGESRANENQTSPHSLTSSQFTELEFVILSTAVANADTLYCFRLSNAGNISNFVFSVQPEITLYGGPREAWGGGSSESQGAGSQQGAGGGVQGGGGGSEGEGGGGQQGSGGGNQGGGAGGDSG